MYDITGDIHGYCSMLKKLLHKLGYQEAGGIYFHEKRRVIFVGDYIDRGPEIRETLYLVKSMVDANVSIAIMGNHEYNAMAYNTQLVDGTYLWEHHAVHNHQHQATLTQFSEHPKEWKTYLEWFTSLPLFLEMPGLRAVHACWDEAHILWLKSNNHSTLTHELLIQSHKKGSLAYQVINDILKVKEFNIPEKYVWYDKDGYARTSNRVKWWVQPHNAKFGNFLFDCPSLLQAQKISPGTKLNIYSAKDPPVFFGHYWLKDPFPAIQTENVI